MPVDPARRIPNLALLDSTIPYIPHYRTRAFAKVSHGAPCDMHPERPAHRIYADGTALCNDCYRAVRNRERIT